eukprot:gene21298-28230_t
MGPAGSTSVGGPTEVLAVTATPQSTAVLAPRVMTRALEPSCSMIDQLQGMAATEAGSGGAGAEATPLHNPPSHSTILQATPQFLQATPQSLQATPQSLQATPQSLQATPQSLQATPQSLQDSPQFLQATPQFLQATPQPLQATPQSLQATPQSPQASVAARSVGAANSDPISDFLPPMSEPMPQVGEVRHQMEAIRLSEVAVNQAAGGAASSDPFSDMLLPMSGPMPPAGEVHQQIDAARLNEAVGEQVSMDAAGGMSPAFLSLVEELRLGGNFSDEADIMQEIRMHNSLMRELHQHRTQAGASGDDLNLASGGRLAFQGPSPASKATGFVEGASDHPYRLSLPSSMGGSKRAGNAQEHGQGGVAYSSGVHPAGLSAPSPVDLLSSGERPLHGLDPHLAAANDNWTSSEHMIEGGESLYLEVSSSTATGFSQIEAEELAELAGGIEDWQTLRSQVAARGQSLLAPGTDSRDYQGPDPRDGGPDYRGPDYRGPDSRDGGPDYRGPDSRDYQGPDPRDGGPDYRGPDSRDGGPDYRGPDSRDGEPDYRGPDPRDGGPDYRGPDSRDGGPDYREPDPGFSPWTSHTPTPMSPAPFRTPTHTPRPPGLASGSRRPATGGPGPRGGPHASIAAINPKWNSSRSQSAGYTAWHSNQRHARKQIITSSPSDVHTSQAAHHTAPHRPGKALQKMYVRSVEWRESCAARYESERKAREDDELKDCTFRPKLNTSQPRRPNTSASPSPSHLNPRLTKTPESAKGGSAQARGGPAQSYETPEQSHRGNLEHCRVMFERAYKRQANLEAQIQDQIRVEQQAMVFQASSNAYKIRVEQQAMVFQGSSNA